MTSERKPISKRMRFEVFKRDSFTCQYCGRKAPDAILHIDHIEPVSRGGKTVLMNLITACDQCNSGKSNIPLDDSTAVSKARAQADQISERKSQIDMMAKWHKSLLDIEDKEIEIIQKAIQRASGYRLNDNGIRKIRLLRKTYAIDEVINAISISSKYLVFDEPGGCTDDSFEEAFRKLPNICKFSRQNIEYPAMPDIAYTSGILKNRFGRYKRETIPVIKEYHERGVLIDELKNFATDATSYDDFIEKCEEAL